MLAPLSWLQEYIHITLPPKKLAQRLTEVGLNVEKVYTLGKDTIFDIEITPNRPDCLSIIGIAREIAAIEGKQIIYPVKPLEKLIKKPSQLLPLTITTNYEINQRFTSIIMENVVVADSPVWLQEKLIAIGQRPINNVVDITNYVMFALGNPLHAFDYDTIKGHTMQVTQTKGGEPFTSVDGISYYLPKHAVVIKDTETIIDLCGIKGGYSTRTTQDTKRIVLRVPIEDPVLIRRTSQMLNLRSHASSIFERGVNKGGTRDTLSLAIELIQTLAHGTVASEIFDYKRKEVTPWNVSLRLERLEHILGITIPEKHIITILKSLSLDPKKEANETLTVTIPTHRNDIKQEEDLIEEIARIYGYNNFPKTIPSGQIPVITAAFAKDYRKEAQVKHILTSANFSEIYTYSLISEADLSSRRISPEHAIRVDNPVSRDYEYLRPTLLINLEKAYRQNKPYNKIINLFELGKVYEGKSIKNVTEQYMVAGITNTLSFYQVKGLLEMLFSFLGITKDPTSCITMSSECILFSLPVSFEKKANATTHNVFHPLPKYPSIREDIAFIVPSHFSVGELVTFMKTFHPLITHVSLLDHYEKNRTFHIEYQDETKNLTTKDVETIRTALLLAVEKKFSIRPKQ